MTLPAAISVETHPELYRDWRKAVAFSRAIPDASPAEPVAFHMFWRQHRPGFWRADRLFGRKQALPVKSFFATQDLSRATLTLWSDTDLSGNEWLRPFAPRMTFRIYNPSREVQGTVLAVHPDVYTERDGRVWRDGDLFRALVLHNYGGVYVDMDIVMLRSLGPLLGAEFIYQWDAFEDQYNGAVMHLHRGSAFARELLDGILAIKPGASNWGRANFRRAFDRGVRVCVFPCGFFDADWQAIQNFARTFRPFDADPAADLHDGAFAWHWHNHWDDRIEHGSRFQRFEARIDAQLTRLGFDVDAASVRVRA